MSVGLARIEHMFDKLAGLDEVELLVAMSEAQRDERRAVARRLVAAAREVFDWRTVVDTWHAEFSGEPRPAVRSTK